MQVVVVVADDGDLLRIEPGRHAEAEHHAGLRLDAETAVVTGDIIEIGRKAEAIGRLADRPLVVAGSDAEAIPFFFQVPEEAFEIGDRHGMPGGIGRHRIELFRQRRDRERRTGLDEPGGDLHRVAGRQQAVGHHIAAHRIHAAGGEKPAGEHAVALRRKQRKLAVHRQPGPGIIQKRTVLVEKNA